jgi:uncharacterized RDD family membrane protein YckC
VIDWLIIFVPLSLIASIVKWGMLGFYSLALSSAFFFLYCALFDYAIGGTVGKMLLGLKAVSVTGKMDVAQAIMRNITKIISPLLLIDWIIGMAIDTNDPRQKWTDSLVNTSVILISRPVA